MKGEYLACRAGNDNLERLLARRNRGRGGNLGGSLQVRKENVDAVGGHFFLLRPRHEFTDGEHFFLKKKTSINSNEFQTTNSK